MTDPYERMNARIDRQDERLNMKFGQLEERLRELGRLVTRTDEHARLTRDSALAHQQRQLAHGFDDVIHAIRRIAESQRKMQTTLDLIRAAVILGPEAVRYAMAWDGPPPFIATAPVTGSPAPVADSATASSDRC